MQRRHEKIGRTDKSDTADVTAANAEIKIQNGIVTLFVSGKATAPLLIDLNEGASPAGGSSGSSLFRLINVDLGWAGPAQFDYSRLDTRISALVGSNSDACFLLKVCVDAPDWWRKAHRDECAEYIGNPEANRGISVSWASQRWRNEAGSALARLVRHIHQAQNGNRCIGWQLTAGEAGEWRYPNAADLPDVGSAMTAHFRRWAVEKYRRNAGLLRKAWLDARGEFQSIPCLDARERLRGDFGVLRNPRRSMRTLDYYECLSDAQNTAALHFCAQTRRACDGRALVGLTYATVTEIDALPEDGHGLPEPVLDSEDVQFVANRGADDGSYPRALTGSLALRGKLLFHEAASGRSLAQAAAIALTHQCGLAVPSTAAPEKRAAVLAAMERALPLSSKVRRRTSPIAVVMDMANRHYIAEQAGQPGPLNTMLVTSQIEEMTRAGAPFDLYLLSDLFHPKFPDHKIVLFLNTFYLSEAERRRVDARIKRSGQTAVWLWGAGLIGEEGVSADYGLRLTGQKTRVETGAISLRVRIAETNDPLTWGQHPGAQFGPDRAISPVVTVADKTVTRLGANTDNKTVFSIRRGEGWTSVVAGTSRIPSGLVVNLLRAAGAHIYTECGEGVTVYADSRSVAVSSARGGKYQISLPGRFDVVEGWANRPAAQGVMEFSASVGPGETAYFELIRRGADPAEARPAIKKSDRRAEDVV